MSRQCAGLLKLFIKCLYIYYVPHKQLKNVQGKFCYQVLACELDPVCLLNTLEKFNIRTVYRTDFC